MNNTYIIGSVIETPKKEKIDDKIQYRIKAEVKRDYKNSEGIIETDIIECIIPDDGKCEIPKKGNLIGIKSKLETEKINVGDINIDTIILNAYDSKILDKNDDTEISVLQSTVIGRFVKDPELRTTSTNKSVCNFTLAVPSSRDKTNFIKFAVWNNFAENIGKNCHKGDLIGLNGSLKQVEKEINEQKISVVEMTVENYKFLCKANNQNKDVDEELEQEI